MTDQPTTPPTELELDEIAARHTAATPGPWKIEKDYCDCSEYGCSHPPFAVAFGPFTSFENTADRHHADAEFAAHARTDVPLLLAEVRRLRAELRIGSPWKCHVCGKGNHRDVCVICETDRPDAELAASEAPAAPLRALQGSEVPTEPETATEAPEGRVGARTLPTAYVVSCLPEGHDERLTYTITVQYRGEGLYAIVRNALKFWGTDGTWQYEPNWDDDGGEAEAQAEEKWLAAHRFGHDEALRLAREIAPTLTYRGRTVADALAEEATR